MWHDLKKKMGYKIEKCLLDKDKWISHGSEIISLLFKAIKDVFFLSVIWPPTGCHQTYKLTKWDNYFLYCQTSYLVAISMF